jgi:hypothetical protein
MHNTPTRIYAPLGVVALTVALVLGLASPASALVLLDREDARLSLRGLAEASYMIESAVDEQGHSSFGPVLDMARLDLRAEREHLGALHFQLEGASDDLQVLDAEVSLHPLAPLYIHLGHFKTPISAEFLVARPHLLLPRRAALSQLITRRLTGVELDLHTELGHHWGLRTQVAVFQPEGVEVDGPHTQFGALRFLLEMPHELELHLAYGQHLGTIYNKEIQQHLLPHDEILDVALMAETGPLTMHLEGVVVFRGPQDHYEWGAYGNLGWRFVLPSQGVALTPAVGVDWIEPSELDDYEAWQRVSVALNLSWLGDDLVTQLGYDATFERSATLHGLFLNLQVGI